MITGPTTTLPPASVQASPWKVVRLPDATTNLLAVPDVTGMPTHETDILKKRKIITRTAGLKPPMTRPTLLTDPSTASHDTMPVTPDRAILPLHGLKRPMTTAPPEQEDQALASSLRIHEGMSMHLSTVLMVIDPMITDLTRPTNSHRVLAPGNRPNHDLLVSLEVRASPNLMIVMEALTAVVLHDEALVTGMMTDAAVVG